MASKVFKAAIDAAKLTMKQGSAALLDLKTWKIEKVLVDTDAQKFAVGVSELKAYAAYSYKHPIISVGIELNTAAVLKYDLCYPDGKIHYIDKVDLLSVIKSKK